MSKKKKLIPELRFPEFENEGEWEVDIVDNLVSTITPPRKLTSSDYQKDGKFPIIDQSKSFYCGWTNDVDAVIKDDLPLIIFGDHTCILKITNKPFVQGADGIKILKTKNKVIPEFLYQYLQYNEVKQEDYKRHFSILKEKSVLFPKKESGEQQKIASCLSSLDDLISNHSQKLDLLKDHKKGLMQNLFPQEGEKVPKLRFKEFEKDGEWVKKSLEEVATILKGKGISKADIVEDGELPCIRYGELYTHYNETISTVKSYTNSSPKDLILSKANDVIIPASGETQIDIAKASCVLESGVALGGDLNIIRSKINGVFLSYYLNNAKKHDIAQMAQGIAVVHLYPNQLKTLKLQIPNPKEQQKIALCLSSLDALITTQTEKIEQLNLHKKGLMQGLFPKIED